MRLEALHVNLELADMDIATVTGELMSATGLLIEQIGFRRYRALDLLRLTG